MATTGVGYFDAKGQFFKTPEGATLSELATLLGKVGEGESLAPGIAQTLLASRAEIERIFAEHDAMVPPMTDADAQSRAREIAELDRLSTERAKRAEMNPS